METVSGMGQMKMEEQAERNDEEPIVKNISDGISYIRKISDLEHTHSEKTNRDTAPFSLENPDNNGQGNNRLDLSAYLTAPDSPDEETSKPRRSVREKKTVNRLIYSDLNGK